MCIDYILPYDSKFNCLYWFSKVCPISPENLSNPETDPGCVCEECGLRRLYLDGVLATVDPQWLIGANIELGSADWLHLLICNLDEVNAMDLIKLIN